MKQPNIPVVGDILFESAIFTLGSAVLLLFAKSPAPFAIVCMAPLIAPLLIRPSFYRIYRKSFDTLAPLLLYVATLLFCALIQIALLIPISIKYAADSLQGARFRFTWRSPFYAGDPLVSTRFPKIWKKFSCALPRETRERVFEPEYEDMCARYLLAQLDCESESERRWLEYCFTFRTIWMVGQCFYAMVIDNVLNAISKVMAGR